MTRARSLVIDVGGIGYQVHVPLPTALQLAGSSATISLYTSLVLKENSLTLYGFLSQRELETFELLIGVTGIGPQSAITILSHTGVDDLISSIITEDVSALTKISGIGKKSAQRLILELKDKIKELELPPVVKWDLSRSLVQEAISALVSLGFDERKAKDAVMDSLNNEVEPSLKTLIRSALSKVGGR